MAQQIFKTLHAYHPDDSIELARVDIFVYRDSLVVAGYQEIGLAMNSFIHYQFEDLNLPNIYSNQLQMIHDHIPTAYQRAAEINIYHAESHYILIPLVALDGLNGYDTFRDLHSITTEKMLIDTIPAIESIEYYNYPYRVYNDYNFAFERAHFHSVHRPMFDRLKQMSSSKTIFYASIKSKSVEIHCFRDETLLFSNSFDYQSIQDICYFMQAVLKDMNLNDNSDDIYISCIQKEHQEAYFHLLQKYFPHCNEKATDIFGFPLEFWNIYGDLILCS